MYTWARRLRLGAFSILNAPGVIYNNSIYIYSNYQTRCQLSVKLFWLLTPAQQLKNKTASAKEMCFNGVQLYEEQRQTSCS
jgi:hypothetical protein